MENKIFIKKETMKGIADAIRAKDGTTEEIAVTDMAERIGAISGGLALEEWLRTFSLASLNAFQGPKVTLNLNVAYSLNNMCSRTNDSAGKYLNTTVKELTINCPNKVDGLRNMVACNNAAPDYTLKKIVMNVDTSEIDTAGAAFLNCAALESIEGSPLNFTSITYAYDMIATFGGCAALAEVRFSGEIKVNFYMETCVNISKASLLSAFSCFADDVEGLTATFKRGRIDKIFETSDGANDGSTSAEWAELIATKPNWTISLA